ncbi:type II toxin-antitoxin system VapB family antitoxin [Thiomonas bhubaneswarensis]|uniref:Transcription regulator of the Arc/MetJ class n=1 Tax=Thiomonas bhubaneswarensis TaxID=339866 RepID=A0A0K6HRL6_9BURK|nr:type II toxin-antitoxin system VapB family antitoxin [Thiomonas bhubaneswarensis]CUA93491.1 Transcription regulator of the Arc/MetJ class [Thiomonas bhubaneswarensis]
MRTNIDIDDALMAAAMEAGGFKTKKEAVEEGLRLLRRRKVYEGLLALRGQLQWDDSDAAWAAARVEQDAASLQLAMPGAAYASTAGKRASKTASRRRVKSSSK